ncbi:hypothetical protein CANINC_001600, partial [Pichia inconspicua]
MVAQTSESISNNENNNARNNSNEANGLEPVYETAFEDPVLPKVVLNFRSFIKDFKFPIILKSISDFPGWYGNTNFAFDCIGLKNVINKLIEAKINGRRIIYQTAEEQVIKSVLSLSVDTEKFTTSSASSAQDI